jgi:uridine phosphorylase|tara:strand:- start:2 stop:805 length:804 start_codon:yes stop_codon:yes gene_type:complete
LKKIDTSIPPILRSKKYDDASLFVPENLLREARRQKNISECQVPSICILDPDGDILDNLLSTHRAKINPYWACYHTELYNFKFEDIEFGIIGCAVGASFAVLIAEELFVSGCQLLISVTSSDHIIPREEPPFFVLIERAWRDEGTSYHYMPPSDYSYINREILAMLEDAFSESTIPVNKGATWTTDAPFRETAIAIEQAKSLGILAVEMEASALYAFAQVRHKAVICFAHVTNQMGNVEVDFEKGEANGSRDALELIAATAKAWLQH